MNEIKTIKVRTIKNKEISIPVQFPKPRRAFEARSFTKDCENCGGFVPAAEANPVLKALEANKDWRTPKETKGLCVGRTQPRILVSRGREALYCLNFKK